MLYLSLKDAHITVQQDLYDQKVEKIPPGAYVPVITPFGHFLQHRQDKFEVPEKLFGDSEIRRDVIFKNYLRRSKKGDNTGALLYGKAGSGKTALVKSVANLAIEKGIPVIMVEERLPPELLRLYIKQGPCVVLFDEMEKIYGRHDSDSDVETQGQDSLLTLLSDDQLSNVLWLATVNSIDHVSPQLRDRPGRFTFLVSPSATFTEAELEQFCEYYDLPSWYCSLLKHNAYKENLTYDAMMNYRQYAKSSKTLEEFANKTKFLNISPIRVFTIFDVTIELEEQFIEEVKELLRNGEYEKIKEKSYAPLLIDPVSAEWELTDDVLRVTGFDQCVDFVPNWRIACRKATTLYSKPKGRFTLTPKCSSGAAVKVNLIPVNLFEAMGSKGRSGRASLAEESTLKAILFDVLKEILEEKGSVAGGDFLAAASKHFEQQVLGGLATLGGEVLQKLRAESKVFAKVWEEVIDPKKNRGRGITPQVMGRGIMPENLNSNGLWQMASDHVSAIEEAVSRQRRDVKNSYQRPN